jgi:DNA-binding transcriptional MerR regulator
MFRIGEFAQIAQVSGRQLRFYDQLGLLRPAHTDPQPATAITACGSCRG